MTSGSETSRTITSRACLEDAASAAVRAKSRLVGRGELLRSVRSVPTTVPSRGPTRTWEISLGNWSEVSVEAVLVDVAGHAVGDQVVDGGAAGYPGADVAGGDGQGRDLHAVDPVVGVRGLADQAVEVEAGPGGGDELGLGEHLVGLLPGEDLEDGVGPGDEEQASVLRLLGPEPAQGVDGVGGALVVDLQPADREGRVRGGGDLGHPVAVLGRAHPDRLLPGPAGGDEHHPVQLELPARLLGGDQVAVVDGVEGAAHDPDAPAHES